ncbi:hypothetical protein UFOVP460_22 [uncultured Caudovirales phage]|uniref:Uncharacterized protein n=1 Tax=uncultured Caudovirales phage TaxID=2100421 RepID=A0A6J5MGL2_9CAUD|nr:hypothetical protein UFOVP460_22 [uncultured Caudovirales phage]
MIHEFRNPVPVKTDLGYGYLLYVQSGGMFCNDIFAVVMENDGGIRHMLTDQFCVIRNDTFDIKNDKA